MAVKFHVRMPAFLSIFVSKTSGPHFLSSEGQDFHLLLCNRTASVAQQPYLFGA